MSQSSPGDQQALSDQKAVADLELLIEEFKRAGLRELHVRHGEFEIYLSQDADAPGLGGAPAAVVRNQPAASLQADTNLPAATTTTAATAPAATPELGNGAVLVRAPYLGTFYRSPKPGSPPYVEIGALVMPESEICLVEVMKLFTAVRAGIAGRVVEVLASDGDMVTADQPLFVIAPV